MIVFICFEGFIDASCVLVLYTVDQIYHLASPASPPNYMYNPIKVMQKWIHKLYHNGFVCGNLLWWISIWIWSIGLYNFRGNQINNAQITILQSLFTNEIKSNVGFLFFFYVHKMKQSFSWRGVHLGSCLGETKERLDINTLLGLGYVKRVFALLCS